MNDEMLGRLWAAANVVEPTSQTLEGTNRTYWNWDPPAKWSASVELPWIVLNPNPLSGQTTYGSEREAYTKLGEVIRTILVFTAQVRKELPRWVETAL